MQWCVEGCIYAPAKVLLVLHHAFLPVKPERHLWELVLEVGRSVSILCKINVKSLGKFCIEIVCQTIEQNKFVVMTSIVKLGNLEMTTDTKRNENIMV